MWLFVTTTDKYDRAFSLVGGHFYLNFEEDDRGDENRRMPYIELAYPVHRFVIKFEPTAAAEQFYQRLKSAIKVGRSSFDSVEEGFSVTYLEEEPCDVQVTAYDEALDVRVVR